MDVQAHVAAYLAGLPEQSRSDMEVLHGNILRMSPSCRVWFSDGKDSNGKIVSNPSIGYGTQTVEYASGDRKAFFRVGISANTGGISVYIMGIKDKTYLARTYAAGIGKAKVTGYCIKFRRLKDIDVGVLETAIRDGLVSQPA